MKILFKSRRMPGVSDAQVAALRLQEAAAVWKLLAGGVLRELWFSPDGPAAFGMLECENLEAAQAVMRTLPMPAAGLIDFDFWRLQPYDQFALLFKPEFQP